MCSDKYKVIITCCTDGIYMDVLLHGSADVGLNSQVKWIVYHKFDTNAHPYDYVY